MICLLLVSIICFALPGAEASAAADTSAVRYARADAREIYFCKEKDISTALFAIPYTYCVRILATEDEWYFVRYAEDNGLYRALEGYCLKESLTPVDELPENIYLNKTVTLSLAPNAPSNGSLPVSNKLNVTAAFYGVYYMGGAAYSCSLYEDSFFYELGLVDYPLNEIPEPPAPAAKKKSGVNTKLIVALALTALAAAALIILYFTGRSRRYHEFK